MAVPRNGSRPHASLDLDSGAERGWVTRARCGPDSGINPELFFPVVSGRAAELQRQEAKAVCRLCPVKSECLEEILEEEGPATWGHRNGIRGGMDEKERAFEAKRRGMKAALKPCGSRAAYQRHRKNMEEPCVACVEANRKYHAEKEADRTSRGTTSWQKRVAENRARAS